MSQKTGNGPFINLDAEPTPEQKAEMLAQLSQAMRPPPPPPTEALALLFEAACHDTGGSQAIRNFLFWLAGLPDPTGFEGNGGLELRRLDGAHKAAALEVLTWWAGPIKSDQPLYQILQNLRDRFSTDE
jgi:hypothetical protein